MDLIGHLQLWCFMVSLKPVYTYGPKHPSVYFRLRILCTCVFPSDPNAWFPSIPPLHILQLSHIIKMSAAAEVFLTEKYRWRDNFEDISALLYRWLVESWKISSAAVFLRKCHQCEEYFNKRRRCTTDRSGVLLPWPTFNKQTLIHLCLTSFCTE